jgi:hypothetical protein
MVGVDSLLLTVADMQRLLLPGIKTPRNGKNHEHTGGMQVPK